MYDCQTDTKDILQLGVHMQMQILETFTRMYHVFDSGADPP